MFAAVMLALYFRVFEFMSGKYFHIAAFAVLVVVLALALKILGNPFAGKEKNDDKQILCHILHRFQHLFF